MATGSDDNDDGNGAMGDGARGYDDDTMATGEDDNDDDDDDGDGRR